MAIIQFWETFTDRGHTINERYEREYTRTFMCVSNSRIEDPASIRIYPATPKPWSFYVGINGTADLGAWCREVEVRQDTQDPFLWHITAHYSSAVNPPDKINPNPILRPPVVTWGSTGVMVPLTIDRDGNPVLNSANERFDPPPEVEDMRLTLRIEINQLQFAVLFVMEFINTVNEKEWAGLVPGCARCVSIGATREFENGLLYWKVTYDFQIRPDRHPTAENDENAWAFRILDRGMRELNNAGEAVPIFIRGMVPTTPVLLNGNGKRLPANGAPIYRTAHPYPKKDFNELIKM